eukprot:2490796-Pyramimonas_sp.AAC.1
MQGAMQERLVRIKKRVKANQGCELARIRFKLHACWLHRGGHVLLRSAPAACGPLGPGRGGLWCRVRPRGWGR